MCHNQKKTVHYQKGIAVPPIETLENNPPLEQCQKIY